MRNRDRGEDAKNLSVIVGAGLVAVLVTAGFLTGAASMRHETTRIVVRTAPPPPLAPPVYVSVTPLSGSNRIYGRVATVDGSEYTGFIRWDKNEGSWADLLDATKISERGGGTLSGIRFGHVWRIQALGDDQALFTLRSGREVMMGARATDLGSGMRALVVDDEARGTIELGWSDLDMVEFEPTPEDARPAEGRLFGTLRTRSGHAFTGYVTWDVDEIYSSDVLDGEEGGIDREIPFGAIASIAREDQGSARVTLHTGDEMVLRGTNDVDSSNRGIAVSDPLLGQIQVRWDEFESVRFHEADQETGYPWFDGGDRLRGVVVDVEGREWEGLVAWDDDESYSWELLNGDSEGIEFAIEFGNIATIEKSGTGAFVTLKDGRSFELHGSNDVDQGNRGVVVEMDGAVHKVRWEDFRELRLER